MSALTIDGIEIPADVHAKGGAAIHDYVAAAKAASRATEPDAMPEVEAAPAEPSATEAPSNSTRRVKRAPSED